MSRTNPIVGDVFWYPETGHLPHRAIWAMDIGTNAVVVPIGSKKRGMPIVRKDELSKGVLSYDSCLLMEDAKLTPSADLARSIKSGSFQYLDTCRPEFLEWVIDKLYEYAGSGGDLRAFVADKLPPRAGAPRRAPRRPTV